MKRFISIFFALLAGIASAGQLGLLLNWADFIGDSAGMTWLEVYSSIRRENFAFRFDSTTAAYRGTLFFALEIIDRNGAKIDSLSYSAPIAIPENEQISKQSRILNAYPLHLPVGQYFVRGVACDMTKSICDTVSLEISLTDYAREHYSASGIMLAYTATQSDEQSTLVRDGTKMYPNPGGVFDLNSLVAYYYTEFYVPAKDTCKYGVNARITAADTLFRKFDTDWRMAIGGFSYIGGFSIAGFPDGYYVLRLELTDSTGKKLAATERNFIVAKQPQADSEAITPELASKMRDILYYLLKPEELRLFDELSPSQKAAFWTRFWSLKDPTPDTPQNEFMEQFVARWNYADRAFASSATSGWRTDQGRIYIVYGAPSNIERHAIGASANSWEMWTYFEKNYFFIFADVLGLGLPKLVHSNVDGEISNENWDRQLLKGLDRSYDKHFNEMR